MGILAGIATCGSLCFSILLPYCDGIPGASVLKDRARLNLHAVLCPSHINYIVTSVKFYFLKHSQSYRHTQTEGKLASFTSWWTWYIFGRASRIINTATNIFLIQHIAMVQ